jgi:putative ABC transport system substrate-binding protein
MRRREFIAFLGNAAAPLMLCPVAARAQAMPVIGFLFNGLPDSTAYLAAAFRKGLSEMGFVEGQSVVIEYRYTRGELARLPELAADLVRRKVAVIASPGGRAAALAAKTATTSIPIVFEIGTDPVEDGLVASFNRPGGNITGVTAINGELDAKRLGLLCELVPGATRIGVVTAPSPAVESQMRDLQTKAAAIGRQIEVLVTGASREIDEAFASLTDKRVDALLVRASGLLAGYRAQLVTAAARYAIPAIYSDRPFAEAGGLMSYGSDGADQFRLVGVYVGRILKGEKPADLPVLRPTKFELVINLKTAKMLGLEVSPSLLASTDEVIE